MPQVGKKKYPYTKKGKAAAAKARKKQKRGPMPKVNPEFAKEMEEANKPKQKAKDPHKEYKARQRRGRDIQRASDAAKMKETEGYEATGEADLPSGPISGVTREVLQARRRRKAEREQAAREKARADRKKRQGTIGAAKRRTQRRAKKGRTSSRDPQSRHFRGIGKKAKRT